MQRLVVGIAGLIAGGGFAYAESQLKIEKREDTVEINWSGGILQTAASSLGPWTSLPDAISPLKPTLAQRAFYRVQETYGITVSRAGSGGGAVNSTGILCGTDCSEAILSGQTVSLQAVPEAGSTFTGWTGDCTGTADCQIMMNGPKSVTATFTKAAALNPVINSSFEEGTTGWLQQPDQLIVSATSLGIQAHTGEHVARLGYAQDNRRVVKIGQQITLPQSTPLFLNFATWIYSEELCDVPYYDAIAVYVAGQAVVNDDRLCRSSNTDGWRRYSIDFSAAAGQTLAFVFELSSVDFLTSIVLLDDIAISDKPWQ